MPEEKKNTLIIFDLVATLANAGPRYAEAFERVCVQFGVAPPPQEDILGALGNKNLKQITDEYAGYLEEDEKRAFMEACNSTCDLMLCDVHWHEALFENVRPALNILQSQGYVFGIYTGTRDDAMAEQLRYHNISRHFDDRFIRAKNNERDGMINSDDLKQAQLSSIVDAYRKESDGTVIVVGDSKSDYVAASSLGLAFVGFASCDHAADCLRKAGVHDIFDNFIKLPEMITQKLSQIVDNKPAGHRSSGPSIGG